MLVFKVLILSSKFLIIRVLELCDNVGVLLYIFSIWPTELLT